jgi:hypothetical protein
VSAVAATAAFAGPKRALAKAVADSEARGPKTVTRTITKAFTVVTEQFRAAVAIAEAVARSFFGAPDPQPSNPLAGLPKPKALAEQAIASTTGDPVAHKALAFATGDAVARGPRTLTQTLTDSYANVGRTSVTAVATSVSVAVSAGSRLAATSGKAGLKQAVQAANEGEGTEPTGGRKTATDSGPGGAATGGDSCPRCQEASDPPALY